MARSAVASSGARPRGRRAFPWALPVRQGLPALALALALAAVVAALWTVALWGRTSLTGMPARWLLTFLAGTLAIAVWVRGASRAGGFDLPAAAGLIPAAALALPVLGAVYLSETVHHAFTYRPVIKGLALPATCLLVAAAPVCSAFVTAPSLAEGVRRGRLLLARHRDAVAAVTLTGAGALQALSFTGVATDDLIRYWSIADGIAAGAGYPVTTGSPDGTGFYLIELPVYPLLAVSSFLLAGHRYFALQLPLIAANVLLPAAFYALARAAGAGRAAAVWLALSLLCLPHYQVYALGAPQPESLLALWLTLALLLALRLMRAADASAVGGPAGPGTGSWLLHWIGLGAAGALAVLTRPEGVLYVGPLALGVAWRFRQPLLDAAAHLRPASAPGAPGAPGGSDRGPATTGAMLLAAATGALPIAAFALFLRSTYGVWWPSGWASVAGPQYIWPNVERVLGHSLPHYAAVAGLPSPRLAAQLIAAGAVAVAVVGLALMVRRRPALWFVVLALLLNLAVIFLSPTYLTLDLFSPPTFFRHISVLFPWLIPAFAAVVAGLGGIATGWGRIRSSVPRAAGLALAAATLAAELYVLGTATARDQAQVPTIFTSDPYVLVSDLWQAPDSLPALPMVRGADGGVTVDPAFDYLAFRRRLFDAVRPYDLHFNDAGRAHVLATGVFALAGLGALGAAGHRHQAQA